MKFFRCRVLNKMSPKCLQQTTFIIFMLILRQATISTHLSRILHFPHILELIINLRYHLIRCQTSITCPQYHLLILHNNKGIRQMPCGIQTRGISVIHLQPNILPIKIAHPIIFTNPIISNQLKLLEQTELESLYLIVLFKFS